MPLSQRRRLISFLAIASSYVSRSREAKDKILRPLIDRLANLKNHDICVADDNDNEDVNKHTNSRDMVSSRRWALFVFNANHSEVASSLPSPSIFFRRKHQRNRIESLKKSFIRCKRAEVENGDLSLSSTGVDSIHESRLDRSVANALNDANQSLEIMDTGQGGELNDADGKISRAVEFFRNWLDARTKDGGGGGGGGRVVGAAEGPAVDSCDASIISAPSTQLSSRANCSEDIDPIISLNDNELVHVLRFCIADSGDGDRDFALPLAPLLNLIVAWQRGVSAEGCSASTDGSRGTQVFDYVSSKILIPQLLSLTTTPSRAVFGSLGEFRGANKRMG